MNSTEKGDHFEAQCLKAIETAIKNGILGFTADGVKLKAKAPYDSQKRGSKIIFDIAAEIWLPKASAYSFLWLIECKDYGKAVPIKEIELFAERVQQVALLNSKAVFISRTPFGKTVKNYAKNTGMMLIELSDPQKPKIVLYSKSRKDDTNSGADIENGFELFLRAALATPKNKTPNVSHLSKEDLKRRASALSNEINLGPHDVYDRKAINKLIAHLKKTRGLKFQLNKDLSSNLPAKLLGSYDPARKKICIDRTIVDSSRFFFVLAHEIAHAVLHHDVGLDQSDYDQYEDSFYDFIHGKHRLTNDKQWVEWQANYFAAALLMPEQAVKTGLLRVQKQLGVTKPGYVFLDKQPVNNTLFKQTTRALAMSMNVTPTNIRYQLNEFGLLKIVLKSNRAGDIVRDAILGLDSGED